MDHFRLLPPWLDPAPVMLALSRFPDLWDAVTVRQTYPGTAHADTRCIFLRAPITPDVFDCLTSSRCAYSVALWDTVQPLHSAVMRASEADPDADLGRVMIVSLKPGGRILRHSDQGAYAAAFSRFHVCLDADPGCVFRCGGDEVEMLPGECWWFDHRAEHSVHNATSRPRIHLIVDVKSRRFAPC